MHVLRFVPEGIGDMTTGFSVLPVYADGAAADLLPVSITLVRQENNAPVAQDVSISTYRDIAVEGVFAAVDPDGDALVFRVTSKARRGEVEVMPNGTFIYTPFPNKAGKDSFTYVAVDPFGNTSGEARVSIRIEKQKSKIVYADMDGHPAHYAALRLHQEGIFTGELICSRHYFRPDEPVSRAEMVVMTLKATGMDGEVVPVSVTGFADDRDIPVWFKPYAQTAVKKGIVDGKETPDGRKTMSAHEPVTLGKAASMLHNAASVTPRPTGSAAENAVTRAEAARMLVHAMDARSDIRAQNGLLSWVFGM